MKTTLNLNDALLTDAKALAAQQRTSPMRYTANTVNRRDFT